ncbi:MAG: hypothetical protein HN769_07060 [Anaerolineae bacterium]|jgi:hypothetical protein|nr:hypothetical protein [Anaerolineae bacterium]
MNTQKEFTIRPVSTYLDGKLLPLDQASGRWDAIQVNVLESAASSDCTGWGLFPVQPEGDLGTCELLTAEERIAAMSLDALYGED